MLRHLLFIPTYNCESQLPRVLNSLSPDICRDFEHILIIDNRSTDQTINVCKSVLAKHPLKSKITLVMNSINCGLGGTHKIAFDYAIDEKFDYVTILHGDDQGSVSDFSQVISSLDGESFYLGARFHPEARLINYSPLRTAGNQIFNCLATLITGTKIHDLGGSGLNSFPVKTLSNLDYRSYSNDLTFHVYLLLDAIRKRYSIRFIPISWREEDQISNAKVFRQGLKLLKILMNFLVGGNSGHQVVSQREIEWEIIDGNLPKRRT